MKAPEKPLLLAIANYADEQGYCYPGIDTLAFDTGYSEPTVKRARKRLEDEGWLLKKRRWSTSNLYRLNLAKLAASQADRQPASDFSGALEFVESAGQAQSDHSDLTGELTAPQSDHCDLSSRITVIPRIDQSDPLSISEPVRDPSIEGGAPQLRILDGGRDGGTECPSTPTQPSVEALELVTSLEFGSHVRPTAREATDLARLVDAARDGGLPLVEVKRHAQAKVNQAKTNAVSYLRRGLAAENLPIPTAISAAAPPRASPDTATDATRAAAKAAFSAHLRRHSRQVRPNPTAN